MSAIKRAFSRLSAGYVGRRIIRVLAYITGTKLFDSRAHEAFDYSRRQRSREDVLHWESIVPGGWREDFGSLWNRINRRNKHPSAVVARMFIGSLVWELGFERNLLAVRQFAGLVRGEFGIAVLFAIHGARTIGHEQSEIGSLLGTKVTNRNIHAHIACSYCTVGPDGSLGNKVAELDPVAMERRGLPIPLTRVRLLWQRCMNEALEQAGLPLRVDMRSLAEQGIDDETTIPLGPIDAALERKGVRTGRGDLNRAARAGNDIRRETSRYLARLEELLKRASTMSAHSVACSRGAAVDLLDVGDRDTSSTSVERVDKTYGAIFLRDGGSAVVFDDHVIIVDEGKFRFVRGLLDEAMSRFPAKPTNFATQTSVRRSHGFEEIGPLLPSVKVPLRDNLRGTGSSAVIAREIEVLPETQDVQQDGR